MLDSSCTLTIYILRSDQNIFWKDIECVNSRRSIFSYGLTRPPNLWPWKAWPISWFCSLSPTLRLQSSTLNKPPLTQNRQLHFTKQITLRLNKFVYSVWEPPHSHFNVTNYILSFPLLSVFSITTVNLIFLTSSRTQVNNSSHEVNFLLVVIYMWWSIELLTTRCGTLVLALPKGISQ